MEMVVPFTIRTKFVLPKDYFIVAVCFEWVISHDMYDMHSKANGIIQERYAVVENHFSFQN